MTDDEAKSLALLDRTAHKTNYKKGKKRGYKPFPTFRVAGPLPLMHFVRYGTIWHSSMKRSRQANKSHPNSLNSVGKQRNKYGCGVYNYFFAGFEGLNMGTNSSDVV